MHSKIIQVSRDEITQEDWITPEDFFLDGRFEGFVGWIADYVSDWDIDTYRNDIIDSFIKDFGNSVDYCDESFVVAEGFVEKYTEELLSVVKSKIQQCKSLQDATWICETYTGDSFGCYIYEYGFGLTPIIKWIAEWLEEGRRYYIGAVLDYHF